MKLHQKAAVIWDVLVVDADPAISELIKKNGVSHLRLATSVDQAQAEMKQRAADVLLVNIQINDNAGLSLIRKLHEKYPHTELIAMSRLRRSDVCIDAMRAGASDMLLAPIHAADVKRSFDGITARRNHVERLTKRNVRLRQVCKQLNKARHEIGQQVDLLCNDLVRAYQEMAQQLNFTQLTAEFQEALGQEIEIEGLLRKTMEWILKKIGPINAAVYLPDMDRHFALGAYLNLDTEADALLIEDIGATIVKQADAPGRVVSIADDNILDQLFGNAAHRLKGRNWLSVGCFAKNECLGVIVIFRTKNESIDLPLQGTIEAIAPVLGDKIQQALGLYHRLHAFDDPDDNDPAE